MSAHTDRRTLLVVDDEPGILWSLAVLLRGAGYGVVTHSGGCDALAWLQTNPGDCDLAVIDGKLQDVDGVELAMRIRAQTPCRAPLIMMSGYFDRDDRALAEALSSGLIADFLSKPFRHDAMLATIHRVLCLGTGTPTSAPAPRR